MKIGVVGLGVVGSALYKYFRNIGQDIVGFDIRSDRTQCASFSEIIECEVCFICVPTPTSDCGAQDFSALVEVLHNLDRRMFTGVVVHKCTVLPGTTQHLESRFENLRIVHNPEFLREKYALMDLVNAPLNLISGAVDDANIVRNIFLNSHWFPHYESTEIAKYMHNCFLATKVSFFNEMYDVCAKFGVDYQKIADATAAFGGIGNTHINVPGPDGERGWGGMCFPKDTKTFLLAMKDMNLETLKGAVATNDRLRLPK